MRVYVRHLLVLYCRLTALQRQSSTEVLEVARGYCGNCRNGPLRLLASAYLSATTVNLAEYTGMNNGTQEALQHKVLDLIIVGDSRLAIQQLKGVIACKK